MCLVACGSADAYYHMGIHCWDMAGGAAVVTEAGGVIMDISGESLRQKEKLFKCCIIFVSEMMDGAKEVSCGDKLQHCC